MMLQRNGYGVAEKRLLCYRDTDIVLQSKGCMNSSGIALHGTTSWRVSNGFDVTEKRLWRYRA
jgi:hypothetical protein